MLRYLLLPFASVALLAQDRTPHLAPANPTPPASILASAPFEGVWIDPEPARDGRFWCRGNRYKMSFGPDGARYVPLFSSRAPQHFPLTFHLAGAAEAAPERRGSGFVFRRGNIEERWDLTPTGAEQSFVLPSRPLGNTLVIEVATTLPFTGADAAGLHFSASGWGEVVYGHATAIERDGDRVPLPTTFAAGAIRIELPAELQFPLVVDPFVTTIGVASNEAFDNRNPDVAYSAVADRWCVVMEERISVLDTDIKVRRFNGAGTLMDTDYFETSGAVADQPAVAAGSNAGVGNFCVTWRETSTDIMARRCLALGSVPQAVRTIHNSTGALGGLSMRPDIAGGPLGDFLVVYVVEHTHFPPRIFTSRILAASTSGGGVEQLLHTTIGCVTAVVADAVSPDFHWPIAWNEQATGCLGGDVKMMVLNQGQGIELQATTIAGGLFDDDRHVDIAWTGTQGLVVFDRDQGLHHDVIGQPFERTAAGYALLGGNRNLTTLEPGITVSGNQEKPVVATDGVRFAIAYMEGSTPKPICATFAIENGVVECHEGHVPIATANLDHDDMGIAAMGTTGGALTRYFVVTDERDGLNDYDVQGLFYDGRQTGVMFTTVATGCLPINAPEAQLTPTGSSDLGHSFTVTMTGHRALPIILVGLPQSPTTALCTVLPQRVCRLGVQLPLLLANAGAQFTVSVPSNVSLVGAQLAFQGADLLATGTCGSSLLGFPFAVTDTVQATIR